MIKKDALMFEYVLAVALLVLIVALYAIAFSTLNYFYSFVIAIFSSLLGAFLIPFGFWGADFAFEAERRRESYVYVPFLGRKYEEGTDKKPDQRGRNYTPVEWWNLNWLAISLGVGFLLLGLFVIGYTLGKFSFSGI